MSSILSGNGQHARIISAISTQTFLESHGHSAPKSDIEAYTSLKFSEAQMAEELSEPQNQFFLGYRDGQLAGYSKLVVNATDPNGYGNNSAKLERLYVLAESMGSGLGEALFQKVVKQAKLNGQTGIWLFVWKENHRAIRFYQKRGFDIVGAHNFAISERHTNPNWKMHLAF